MYLDENNLYDCSMSQYLPYSGFRWSKQKEIDGFDVTSFSENSLHGYIPDVDLEYPDKLHGLHNDFPLVPVKLKIGRNMLPKYCNDTADQYRTKVGGVNKLVPNLGNKSKYILHYRNLQLYLSLGMKLIGVHNVSKIKQPDLRKEYIDLSTTKRKNCHQ